MKKKYSNSENSDHSSERIPTNDDSNPEPLSQKTFVKESTLILEKERNFKHRLLKW